MSEQDERPKKQGWLSWLFTARGMSWSVGGFFVFLFAFSLWDDARLSELRATNPSAYLAEIRTKDETKWLRELKLLDKERFEIEMEKRKPAIDRIVADLKKIPASKTSKNIELYKRLTKLDPTNKQFAQKLEHYEDQLQDEQIKVEVTEEINTGFCRGAHSIMRNRILPARFGPAGGVMADRDGGCRVEGEGRARWVSYGYTTALHRSNGISTRYRALIDYDVARDSYLMCVLIWDDGEREVITRNAGGRCPQ